MGLWEVKVATNNPPGLQKPLCVWGGIAECYCTMKLLKGEVVSTCTLGTQEIATPPFG